MVGIGLIMSIAISTAAISVPFLTASLWVPAAAVILLGVVWIGAHNSGRGPWITWAMMGLFTVAAAVGAWLELRPFLLVVGLTAAVSAWDLDHHGRNMENADLVERRTLVDKRHARRLAVVDAISLIAALAALRVRIRLSFSVAILLGLVALIGLSRVMTFLRSEEDARTRRGRN